MQFGFSEESGAHIRGTNTRDASSENQENQKQNDRRSKRLKLLETRRSKFNEAFSCQFITSDSYLGLIIGKQGEKLNQVAKTHKVEIRVLPAHESQRMIKIYGYTESSITRARSDLEFVHAMYPIDEITLRSLMNKNGEIIKEICQKSNLHSLWHNIQPSSLVMCGVEPAIERAVQMIEFHKSLISREISTLEAINPNEADT